jgi:protocatechuate 3,4-dioxygenase beta subunit
MAYCFATSEPAPVTVLEGQVTEGVDFVLVPLTFGALEGYVTDAATATAIEGARVTAWQHVPGMQPPQHGADPGGGCSTSVQTDVDGFYRFEELATGVWRVRAVAQGHVRAESEVEVVADTTVQRDFTLDPR